MAKRPSSPFADIIPPDELLANAENHLRPGDRYAPRAAVLESMAAFETYVQKKVFTSLLGKFDPGLLRWMEEKTKTNLDDRLSVLAPVALGRPVNKNDKLWADYKNSRDIRHKVVHAGMRVTKEKARFVVDTVYKWLSFLGPSIEVQVAFQGLKGYIEQSPKLQISNEIEATDLIVKYFSKTKTATVFQNFDQHGKLPDVLLKFGDNSIVIEAKFIQAEKSLEFVIENAKKQIFSYMDAFNISQGAIVIFYKGIVEPVYQNIQALNEGKLYILVIQV